VCWLSFQIRVPLYGWLGTRATHSFGQLLSDIYQVCVGSPIHLPLIIALWAHALHIPQVLGVKVLVAFNIAAHAVSLEALPSDDHVADHALAVLRALYGHTTVPQPQVTIREISPADATLNSRATSLALHDNTSVLETAVAFWLLSSL
jgi:hypothetical protein